jgi:hypothetical protein
MKTREVVILHQLSINVDLCTGATALDSKYAVYQTGLNFIRIPHNDANAKTYSFDNGYRNMMSRVPVKELMLVQQPSYHDDTTDCVRREIYCLEKDCPKALLLLNAVVDKRIDEMKKEMDHLHEVWTKKIRIKRT